MGTSGSIGRGGLEASDISADEPATWDDDTSTIGVDVPGIDIGQTTGNLSVSRVPDAIPTSQEGVANGIATLGPDGKVPASELNVAGGFNYLGSWDASSNIPTISDGTGSNGDMYKVSVAGTSDLGSGSINFVVGDHVVYTGGTLDQWEKFSASELVSSVQGKVGAVILFPADVNALAVDGGSLSGTLSMSNNAITDVQDPTQDSDAATKSYVDDQISGVDTGSPQWGSITGTISNQEDLENVLSEKVNTGGDTLFGNLNFGSSHTVENLADPVDDQDAATKSYVDNAVAFSGGGSFSLITHTIAGSGGIINLTPGDPMVHVIDNVGALNVQVNLPGSSSALSGLVYLIKLSANFGGGTQIIAGSGTSIEGAGSIQIPSAYNWRMFIFDGNNIWYIIGTNGD